jgi:hypothetical protein
LVGIEREGGRETAVSPTKVYSNTNARFNIIPRSGAVFWLAVDGVLADLLCFFGLWP